MPGSVIRGNMVTASLANRWSVFEIPVQGYTVLSGCITKTMKWHAGFLLCCNLMKAVTEAAIRGVL